MFLFGTTIADWLMNSATNAIKEGTNNSRARPSNHVTRFKQDPCPRPFCTKIWNIWKNLKLSDRIDKCRTPTLKLEDYLLFATIISSDDEHQ